MRRSITLWILALLITLASAYWQRKSGPTYPVDGIVDLCGMSVHYSLTRTHAGAGDQEFVLVAPDMRIKGRMMYRRVNSEDPWTVVVFKREADRLVGSLPHQPPAGKLEYTVELLCATERATLSDGGRAVVTRFKGDVPAGVLIPHILLMFIAMLVSTRAGMEALFSDGNSRPYAVWTLSLLTAGGLVLGPLVQHYAFGEYWTGVPYGTDLTDNKTLIAFVAWFVAMVAVWNRSLHHSHPGRRWYVVAASLILLAVFVIPHSMWGSELKYEAPSKTSSRSSSPVLFMERAADVPGLACFHTDA